MNTPSDNPPPAAGSAPATAQPCPLLPVGVVLDEAARIAHDALWKRLTAPFPEADIEWLLKDDDVIRGAEGSYRGRVFAYVNARAVQQRLDEIFGLYWSTKMVPAPFGTRAGVVCELSVYLPAFGWLTKSDACDLSMIEPVRGGASGALKRVAVQFGVGRYLYSLGESTVVLGEAGGSRRIRVDSKTLTWNPPVLPVWALPEQDRPAREQYFAELAAKEKKAAEEVEIAKAAAKAKSDADAAAKATADAARIEQEKSRTPQAVQDPKPADAKVEDSEKSASKVPSVPEQSNQPRTGGISLGQLSRLQEILGSDTPLILQVLKHKKMLPLGATSVEQLPVRFAAALIENAQSVGTRMKLLTAVSKIINGRFEAATTYCVARSLVRANEPWHVASEASLNKIIQHPEVFSAQLDKMVSNASRVAA